MKEPIQLTIVERLASVHLPREVVIDRACILSLTRYPEVRGANSYRAHTGVCYGITGERTILVQETPLEILEKEAL